MPLVNGVWVNDNSQWTTGTGFANQQADSPAWGGVRYSPNVSKPGSGGKIAGGLLKAGTGLATGNYLQAGLGLVQTIGGVAGAKKIQEQQYPEFTPTDDMIASKTRSSNLSRMGYTPEQRAQFSSMMGMSQNADYKNAINLAGGGLSPAINAARGGSRLRAINDFAAQDAKLKMDNIRYDDSITDKFQRLQNQETQNKIARRAELDRAYGGAIKTGTENFVNAFPGGNAGSYSMGNAFGMLAKMGM